MDEETKAKLKAMLSGQSDDQPIMDARKLSGSVFQTPEEASLANRDTQDEMKNKAMQMGLGTMGTVGKAEALPNAGYGAFGQLRGLLGKGEAAAAPEANQLALGSLPRLPEAHPEMQGLKQMLQQSEETLGAHDPNTQRLLDYYNKKRGL